MKKSAIIFFLIQIFPFFAIADLCTNQSSIHEKINNRTGEFLVSGTFMHDEIHNTGNSSNLDKNNKKLSGSIDGTTYDSMGSVEINHCVGTGGQAYSLGVSVGPYIFITQKGSSPNWADSEAVNTAANIFSSYLLDKHEWSDRKTFKWSIYNQSSKNITVKEVKWSDRNNENACTVRSLTDSSKFVLASVCWAVDLNTCNASGACDTYEQFNINDLGTSRYPLSGPLGK
jgi:hypothetical protein